MKSQKYSNRSLSTLIHNGLFLICVLAGVKALAITNGQPDGNGHPSVGNLISPNQYSDGTWTYCTGTLISPTVFLTAAHCKTSAEKVKISFSANYKDGDKTHTGRLIPHPLFRNSQDDPYDIAVVILDEAVNGITPANLPKANSLSKLSKTQQFTSVGYGAYEVTNGSGGRQLLYNDTRNVSTGTLSSINPAWLRISQNASLDDGGTCYGDSGGPNFLGNGSIIAGLTVTGDAYCRSRNVVYRLDTRSARDFLSQYVQLP